jgi:hypothetical protein
VQLTGFKQSTSDEISSFAALCKNKSPAPAPPETRVKQELKTPIITENQHFPNPKATCQSPNGATEGAI